MFIQNVRAMLALPACSARWEAAMVASARLRHGWASQAQGGRKVMVVPFLMTGVITGALRRGFLCPVLR